MDGESVVMGYHREQTPLQDRSAFAGYRFPPEVILLAVRWYLRYGLSYRPPLVWGVRRP